MTSFLDLKTYHRFSNRYFELSGPSEERVCSEPSLALARAGIKVFRDFTFLAAGPGRSRADGPSPKPRPRGSGTLEASYRIPQPEVNLSSLDGQVTCYGQRNPTSSRYRFKIR
jgi:hypothetical protein